MKKIKVPNFFIVGAPKCGTTSLYNYLKQHPQIFMCPIKEPFYFSKDFDDSMFVQKYSNNMADDLIKILNGKKKEAHSGNVKNWDIYLRLFEGVTDEKAIGEASSGYLYSKVAAFNIKEKIPDAKIIMVLRDPVKRAFSHYLMNSRIGFIENSSFINAVEEDYNSKKKGWGVSSLHIELGLYYEQVKRYLDIFSEKDVKIIVHERLQKGTDSITKEIFDFLGIDRYKVDVSQNFNAAQIPVKSLKLLLSNTRLRNSFRKIIPNRIKVKAKRIAFTSEGLPELKDVDRAKLLPYFSEDIKKLSVLIKTDLSNWLI